MNERRPLVHHGGSIRAGGGPERDLLVHALEAAASEPADRLTHGFHSWTARMHPSLATVLVPELTSPRGAVLDPFSGSGTVPLEAMLHGRAAVGADLNPLAPMLAHVKCRPTTEAQRAHFVATAREAADASLERVQRRANIAVPVPRSVAMAFDGHVLKELGGLREEIEAVTDLEEREALAVVFSSILTKVSKREADSSENELAKRIRKGLPTELFERKARELSERWRQLEAALPRGARPPTFFEADARALPRVLGNDARFDLVLTSPPYGGTYDYVEHHRLRLAFLGLDARGFEGDEIAARRRSSGPGARRRFEEETAGYLEACARLLTPGGALVLFVGDGFVDGELIYAPDHLAHLGEPFGLEPAAFASEARPTRVGPEREEHLLLFRRKVRPSRSAGRPSTRGNGPGQGGRRRGGA